MLPLCSHTDIPPFRQINPPSSSLYHSPAMLERMNEHQKRDNDKENKSKSEKPISKAFSERQKAQGDEQIPNSRRGSDSDASGRHLPSSPCPTPRANRNSGRNNNTETPGRTANLAPYYLVKAALNVVDAATMVSRAAAGINGATRRVVYQQKQKVVGNG